LGAEAEQKNFLFLLPARRSPRLAEAVGEAQVGAGGEEKIWRAQNKKCRESFSARQTAVIGGGRRGEQIFEQGSPYLRWAARSNF